MDKLKLKNLINLSVIIILTVGLGIGIYLVRNQQILRGRALGTPPIEFMGPVNALTTLSGGRIGLKVEEGQPAIVELRLTSPLGPAGTGTPTITSNPTPTNSPSQSPSITPTSIPTPTSASTPTCSPATQTFTAAESVGDYGGVSKSGPGYPPGGSAVVNTNTLATDRSCNTATACGLVGIIGNGMVRWDTSSLPDNATIMSATFKGNASSKYDGALVGVGQDNRSLTADWYNSWPIDASDYSETPQTSAIAGFDITSIVLNANNDFALENFSGNVSKTGYTGLRFHISGGQPTANNRVQFQSPLILTVTYQSC